MTDAHAMIGSTGDARVVPRAYRIDNVEFSRDGQVTVRLVRNRADERGTDREDLSVSHARGLEYAQLIGREVEISLVVRPLEQTDEAQS